MRLIVCAVVGALCSVSVFPQAQYGSIGGRVLDPSGAGLPGASVTITGVETGVATRVVSDAEGT